MSFHVFFSFSRGLAVPLLAPVGTKAAIAAHVEGVEGALGLKRSVRDRQHDQDDGCVDAVFEWSHWDKNRLDGFPDVDDKLLCATISTHNDWVRSLHEKMEGWATETSAGALRFWWEGAPEREVITQDDAAGFWHALRELNELDLQPDRWTREYYTERMEHLYSVMRGRENEGVSFDVKALTPKQAAAVIRVFDRYLDKHDCRLDVPHGHDHLASSYDGGYDWCGTCYRPMTWEDAQGCRRRECELRRQEEE